MACNLTTGRTEPCYDIVGGLKAAYAFDYLEDSFTVTGGEATAVSGSLSTVFKFDLISDNNTLNENLTTDQNNGTFINTQTLSLSLKKQDKDTAAEIALHAKGRKIWVVQDRQDNYRVVGISDGTILTGEIQSGGAKGDFNGYNLTYTAIESEPAPFLDSATVTAFLLLVSATVINP